jgi:alpha/beta superfamily hydrolase
MKFSPLQLFSFLLILSSFSTFGQKEKEVFITNPQGKVYGTLTLPKTKSKEIPVALIIAGSGPTDRNGNNPFMKNNSLKMMSDSLVSMGIATLRYDKQGIGASSEASKTEEELTIYDFIDDVKRWINFLENHKKLGEITLIGHSEGSFFALMAAKEVSVKQVISIAGAGRRIDNVIIEQLQAQSEDFAEEAKTIFNALRNGEEVENISPNLQALFRKSIQPYLISWIKYNPSVVAKELNCAVLVIQGDKDIQVPVEDARLLVGQNKHVELYVIEGMNHILKKVEGNRDANMLTYIDSKLPIMVEFVEILRIIFRR